MLNKNKRGVKAATNFRQNNFDTWTRTICRVDNGPGHVNSTQTMTKGRKNFGSPGSQKKKSKVSFQEPQGQKYFGLNVAHKWRDGGTNVI